MCLRGILFMFCLICLSGLVTSEKEMEFKLPENLKFEINKYVSDIVGQLTDKYENRIKSLEQRIAVLESNERHPDQDSQNGPSGTRHNHNRQDSVITDQGGADFSFTQAGEDVEVGGNQIGQNTIDLQPQEANVADDLAKSANFTRVKESTQRTFRDRISSFKQQKVPGIVQSEFLFRDSRQVGTKVAFFATLTNNILNLGANQDILFDNVIVNHGNGYNSRHGAFVAPVSGVYVFGVALDLYGEVRTWGNLVVNGNFIARLDVRSQASHMTVIYLQQGDDVSVQNEAFGGAVYGDKYSSFSGFLLYQ